MTAPVKPAALQMPAASYLCSPTSWGAVRRQVVGRGVGRGVGAGVERGVGRAVGAGTGVGPGVGTGPTMPGGNVGVAAGICDATDGPAEGAGPDDVGAPAAENDDSGYWPLPGVALVTAPVPNASPSSGAGRNGPPIVNASTDAARTTIPTAANTIGARQALRSPCDAPRLVATPSAATVAVPAAGFAGVAPSAAVALPGGAAVTGTTMPTAGPVPTAAAAARYRAARLEMPHPGHLPPARVQQRSHAYTPQDGQTDSPMWRRCAAGPIRLPHRSQNGKDGPPVAVTRGPIVGSVAEPPPPACGDDPDAGDAFAMDSCLPSNDSPDMMLRALRPGPSNPAGLRHRPRTTLTDHMSASEARRTEAQMAPPFGSRDRGPTASSPLSGGGGPGAGQPPVRPTARSSPGRTRSVELPRYRPSRCLPTRPIAARGAEPRTVGEPQTRGPSGECPIRASTICSGECHPGA